MNDDLKKLIDDYCDAFLSQDIVKKYFVLEKLINESEEVKNKQEMMKKAQKNLALSISDENEHAKALEEFNKRKQDFENDPLIVNYKILKDAIFERIVNLKNNIEK